MFNKLFQTDLTVKILLILLGFFVIQFFFIRPRKKEEQSRAEFLKTLTIGMQVVTVGGLYGKVVKINENTVILETDARGSNLTVKKQALLEKVTKPASKAKEK